MEPFKVAMNAAGRLLERRHSALGRSPNVLHSDNDSLL